MRRRSSSRANACRTLLDELIAEYDKPEHGVTIREVAGGYKMATKPEHHEAVRAFVKSLKPPLKLSLPALETLAVIAYKQPVTAPEIMEIRGVQGAGVLKTLLDRKLIAAAGRKNVIGKPILYKTTKDFLVQFGLKDLTELPSLKEFEEIRRMAIDGDAPEPAPETVAAAEPAEAAVPEAEPETPLPAGAGTELMPEERLQKILSHAGVASRRKAEQIIQEGRVTVNGAVITELGTKADLERDHIKVDGKLLRPPKHLVYHRAAQAAQCRHHGVRSRRPRHGDGPAARRQGARLSGGPPGLSQRRAAAAHQRWRVGQRHHVGGLAHSENLSGEGQRAADRPSRSSSSARACRCAGGAPRRPA